MRQIAFTNRLRFKIVFGQQPPPIIPSLVTGVVAEQPFDESGVVREAFVSARVKSQIKIGVEGRGVAARSRSGESSEPAFYLAVVHLLDQLARNPLEIALPLAPQIPTRQTVVPDIRREAFDRLLIDAQLLLDQIGLPQPLQHLFVKALLIGIFLISFE